MHRVYCTSQLCKLKLADGKRIAIVFSYDNVTVFQPLNASLISPGERTHCAPRIESLVDFSVDSDSETKSETKLS